MDIKDKARQLQADAQVIWEERMVKLQAEGEKLKLQAETAKEAARQKAASIDVAKLKESVVARAGSLRSLGGLPAAAPDVEAARDPSSEVR